MWQVAPNLTGTVTAKKGDTVVAQGATTSDVPDPTTSNNVATARSTVRADSHTHPIGVQRSSDFRTLRSHWATMVRP